MMSAVRNQKLETISDDAEIATAVQNDKTKYLTDNLRTRSIKVYGLLPVNSPYVGTFHYAPSAGNRARQTYFAKDIRSMDQVNKQHAILINPHIGIFHYGDYVYGERFSELQLSLRNFNIHRKSGKSHQRQYIEKNAKVFSYNLKYDSAGMDGSFSHSGNVKDDEAMNNDIRTLRQSARIGVVYASGDNLMKLGERERRLGVTRRFKYNGAIDLCKRYPNGGSIDDCALLRPVGASRSNHYNELLANVNGFRQHFVAEQRASNLNPKDAYRMSRLKETHGTEESWRQQQTTSSPMHIRGASDFGHKWQPPRQRKRSSSENFTDLVASKLHTPRNAMASTSHLFFPLTNGHGSAVKEYSDVIPAPKEATHGQNQLMAATEKTGFTTYQMSHTAQLKHKKGLFGENAVRGSSWIPGTVSAQLNKDSWTNKQIMRDTTKFTPFFVQAKSQVHDAYDLFEDQLLGQGSYAKVILAKHKLTQQSVAIKAVQKKLLFSSSEKACVMHEVENQLRIVHRHVVRLYEVYETPDYLYLVLENCPCGELEKMIYMRRCLKEIEAKRVAKQLLQAVSYLHSKGIVHCDIKPQNLLFTYDIDDSAPSSPKNAQESIDGFDAVSSPAGLLAKLCDFGLSRKVPDIKFFKLTGDVNKIPFSTLCGTGGFIAPEILRQQPFGKAADMWSVGVMIYQMLCGRMPFTPARACLQNPPSYGVAWRNISDQAKQLLDGLLERDPTKRITADEALQHPWLESVQHLKSGFPHFVPLQSPNSEANLKRRRNSTTSAFLS